MFVYVGTYTEPILFGSGAVLQGKGEGIHRLWMDPESGTLRPDGVTKDVANPSWLTFDASRRWLYAVNELKSYEGQATGTVSAFAVDDATGEPRFLNKQPTHGTDPCHVVVDAKRRHVLVANFMSGSVCVLPVRDDGTLGPASDFIQHLGSGIDSSRQTAPHAHSVTLDRSNRHAFVPDLGLDKVFIYKFDAKRGMLEPNGTPWVKMPPGSGPRHVALHPNGRFAYLLNELNSTLAVLALDRPRELQIVSTLPADFHGISTCAGLQLAPSGRFLYASNRGHDSIALWRVDPTTGHPRYIEHTPTLGRTPRGFSIDPTGRFLLVANQDSDTIVPFRINARTGKLTPAAPGLSVPTPVCVAFRAPPTRLKGA